MKTFIKKSDFVLFVIVFVIFFQNNVLSQSQIPELIPYRKGDKWGYCDKNKNIVIPCIYEDVDFFNTSLAIVMNNYNYGLIDKTGKVVVPITNYSITQICDELFFINTGSKSYCLDSYGKIKFNFPKNTTIVGYCSEGLLKVETYHGSEYADIYLSGYFDMNGKTVIPIKNYYAQDFSEGLALVQNENLEFCFINPQGKTVIKLDTRDVRSFSEGFAAIKKNEKWGFIDKTGNLAIPAIYDEVSDFSNQMAKVKLNGKYGFINTAGEMIIQAKYELASSFNENLAVVKENDLWCYINPKGEVVIPARYKHASCFSEGLAAVATDNLYGYIDKNGNLVIPEKYQHAGWFNNGLARVTQNDKSGYIDKNGNEYWED